MPRTVSYTDEATDALAAIRRWYSQPGSGPAARRRVSAILDAIDMLADMPCMYLRGERPGTRVMICREHRIIYSVNPDTGENATAGDVLVLDIRGPGQL